MEDVVSPWRKFAFVPAKSSDESSEAEELKIEVKEEALVQEILQTRTRRKRVAVEAEVDEDYKPVKAKVKKRRQVPRSYADPTIYAHLPQSIQDHYKDNLTLLICGLNPGVMTATTGFHFANPTNLFWPLLASSGITDRLYKPSESASLPEALNIGITNIVSRPSREGGELSRAECVEGSKRVIELCKQIAPRAVMFTGKGIWESVFRAINGRPMKKTDNFEFGWQSEIIETFNGGRCRIFVTMGTSGRVAAYSPAYKREVFAVLGAWMVEQRENVKVEERD